MRRVLIVSPHFPPVNAPDHQRARMALPYFREFGWDPAVLAVDARYVEAPRDELLLQTVPPDAPVYRVPAIDQALSRKIGLGNLGLRALPTVLGKGRQLIKEHRFNLVYISTAMFAVAATAPNWRRKFGTPFIVDFQDPWLNTYYVERPHVARPRKYWFAHAVDRLLEPWTMAKAAGATAVSEAYCKTLVTRYPNLRGRCLTVPFGASEGDRRLAREIEFQNTFFNRHDGLVHGVYVGVVAPSMASTIDSTMAAFADGLRKHPNLFANVRLHFIGTSYAPPDVAKPFVLPRAAQAGVLGYVTESTSRVPYFGALRLLEEADFLLIPGSDDPRYTASKIYPYILAQKPMLAVFHRQSSVVDVLRKTNAANVVAFETNTDPTTLRSEVARQWSRLLERIPFTPDTDWAAFEPFTAREMTRKLCAFFDRMVDSSRAVGR